MLKPHAVAEIFTAAECDTIVALAAARQFSDGGLVRGERYSLTTWIHGPAFR